jgi:hypothetical protein
MELPFASSMPSRAPLRTRLTHVVLSLVGLVSTAGVASTGLGSSGCSNCAALCASFISASGSLPVEAGEELTLRLCIDDDCEECDTIIDGGDDDSCDVMQVVRDGDALLIRRDLGAAPQDGQEITVTITSVESGEVLVDATQSIEEVADESQCGNECGSAEVDWN